MIYLPHIPTFKIMINSFVTSPYEHFQLQSYHLNETFFRIFVVSHSEMVVCFSGELHGFLKRDQSFTVS